MKTFCALFMAGSFVALGILAPATAVAATQGPAVKSAVKPAQPAQPSEPAAKPSQGDLLDTPGDTPAIPTTQADSQGNTSEGGVLDPSWRTRVYMENDSTWLKPNNDTDRWYTNGLLLSISHQSQGIQNLLPDMPFAKSFANSASDPEAPLSAAIGFHGGQLIFTPEDITATTPQYGDHPFGGYAFIGATFERANDITLDRLRVDVGIVGPSSLAGDAQRLIHRNMAGDNPLGWGNQIKDEPAIQVYLRKKWRLPIGAIHFGHDADSPTLSFQFLPEAGVALGTVYRQVDAGAMVRAGFAMPDDFGPGTIANLASITGSATPQGLSCYAFVGVTGQIVEHNVFLENSDFHHNEVEVHHYPLVGLATAGLQVNYRKGQYNLGLTYSEIYSTHEYRGQDGTPAWGTLRIDISYKF